MYKKKPKELPAPPVNSSSVVSLIAIGDVTDFFAITLFAFSSKKPKMVNFLNVYCTEVSLLKPAVVIVTITKCERLPSLILEELIFSPKHFITSFVCKYFVKGLLKEHLKTKMIAKMRKGREF